MKLAVQLDDKMRECSHLWVPLICRRLLSTDKKERDMSERCMLKIKSTIFPPTVALSKVRNQQTFFFYKGTILGTGAYVSNWPYACVLPFIYVFIFSYFILYITALL